MPLTTHFESVLTSLRLRGSRAVVAVSGGLDSVVLLHLLHQTRQLHGLELLVAHADHGMQDVTAARAIVTSLAQRLRCPLLIGTLALGPRATETTARTARLRWLRQVARTGAASAIFLGHHADDQAETVLMRLLRGSGPAGLAGMALRRGLLLRPLLGVHRHELRSHAEASGLVWWEDPANRDHTHLRSWVRQALLPIVTARLPDAPVRLATAARHAAANRQAWSAAIRAWPGLDWRRDSAVDSVDWPVLATLAPPLRISLLHAVLREARCPAGPQRIAHALRTIGTGQSGTTADLGSDWRMELAFGRLRVLPPAVQSILTPADLTTSAGDLEWGTWRLRWCSEAAPAQQERAGPTAWFAPGALRVRPWHAGDRLAPLGGTGRRLVVRCFQEARVPATARAGWPVLEGDGAIAWVPGVCRSGLLLPPAGTPSLRVEVQPRV